MLDRRDPPQGTDRHAQRHPWSSASCTCFLCVRTWRPSEAGSAPVQHQPGSKTELRTQVLGNPTHLVFSVYENETTLNLWVLYKPRSQSWTSLSISHPATVSPSPVNTLLPMTFPPPRPVQGARPGPSGTCLIPVLPELQQPSPTLTGPHLPLCMSSAGADHT